MAIPNSKSTFKDYCLRNLGFGVIDINVSDDQIDDRIDEAVQYFSHYYFDGVEKVYLKYRITPDDITRARGNEAGNSAIIMESGGGRLTEEDGGFILLEDSVTVANLTGTDVRDSSVVATFAEGTNYIPMPSSIVSVLRIFSFDNAATNNMFDIRYQLRLNDLYDFSSTSILHYEMTMQHLDYLSHILVGETPIRFQEHQQRLYLDMDWEGDVSAGDYLIIECYRKLDPETYTDLYDNMHLKRYATALIKKQWGMNLSKFQNVALLGGVTMNGEQIYSQAQEEIEKLETYIENLQYPDMILKG